MGPFCSFLGTLLVPSLGFLIAAGAHAEINLARLGACTDIATLNSKLRNEPALDSIKCRKPSTTLERLMFQRSGGTAAGVCIHQSPPVDFLSSFSCLHIPLRSGAEITCLRSARAADIEDYKSAYRSKFLEQVNSYLVKASQCGVTNGNATFAAPTQLPYLLAFISNFEFGFVSPLGEGRRTDGSILHGYASTDRSIADAPLAIEYVSIHVAENYSSSRADKPTRVRNWAVYTDDAKDLETDFNRNARKMKIPVRLNAVMFKLERDTDISTAIDDKVVLLEHLQNTLAKSLKAEDFTEITAKEMLAKTGKRPDEIIKEVSNNLPVGRSILGMRLGNFRMLFNENRPQCTLNGRGAIAAYLMMIHPRPGVDLDFGEITLMLVGLGSCSELSQKSAAKFMSGLSEDAAEQLLSALEATR